MSYRRSPPPDTDRMISLKVDNLTYRTRKEDLRRAFDKFGDIGDIYIPRDPFSRESLGYAFVRYMDRRDAVDAMEGMDGSVIDGRVIRVQLARYGRYAGSDSRRKRLSSDSPHRRRSRSAGHRRSRRRSHARSNSRSSRYRTKKNRSRSRRRRTSRSRSKKRSERRSSDLYHSSEENKRTRSRSNKRSECYNSESNRSNDDEEKLNQKSEYVRPDSSAQSDMSDATNRENAPTVDKGNVNDNVITNEVSNNAQFSPEVKQSALDDNSDEYTLHEHEHSAHSP